MEVLRSDISSCRPLSPSSSAREIETAARLLDDPDKNTTVLAPENSAIESLGHKVWENPDDYDKFGAGAYEGQEGLERARSNIRRFVEAHLIPASPWGEGERIRPVGGVGEVWWEEKDGGRVVSDRGSSYT